MKDCPVDATRTDSMTEKLTNRSLQMVTLYTQCTSALIYDF